MQLNFIIKINKSVKKRFIKLFKKIKKKIYISLDNLIFPG